MICMKWLRRKLRAWLGVEECHHPTGYVQADGKTLVIICNVASCDERADITLPLSGGVAP